MYQGGICQGIERGQTASYTTHVMPQEHRNCFRVVFHNPGHHNLRGYFQKTKGLILVHFYFSIQG